MIISVMTPSRNRPESMKNATQSLRDTASKPENIEFIVRVDDDDEKLEEYKQIPNINLIVGKRGKGYADTGLFYADMVKVATGKWLMIWGDDGRMLGKGWDDIFYNHTNKLIYGKDWVFFAVPRVVTSKCEFSPTAHPDTWWYQIGQFMPALCIDAQWNFTHIRHNDQTIKDRDQALITSSPAHFAYATRDKLWTCHQEVLAALKEPPIVPDATFPNKPI